jgi:hypothetical protein
MMLVSNTCVASIPYYMRAMENHCPKPYQILTNSCPTLNNFSLYIL